MGNKESAMKFIKSVTYASLLAGGAGLALLLSAVGALASLEVKQNGPVSFVSGGVGEDEIQEIKRLSSNYPLELLFATKKLPSVYLADVKVQIKDKDGKVVLDEVSRGPFFLVKIPPGRYSISVENDGIEQRRVTQVTGARTQRVIFVW